jgi:site-specific recombinase XerD
VAEERLRAIEVAPRNRLAVAVDEYLADCRARGLRSKTVQRSYAWPLRHLFLPWCEAEGVDDPAALTRGLVNRWTVSLHEQGGARGHLKPASILAYVEPVNRWLRWMHEQGEMEHRLKAHRPRLPKRVVEVLTPAEVERMVDTARNVRDRLIVRCLWQTGCRASELLHLRLGDVTVHDRRPALRLLAPDVGGGAKGGRERLVPIPHLAPELRRYIERARPESYSDRLWLSLRRTPAGEFVPLELGGLEQMIRQLAQDAGIKRRVHPHLFRHSAVTHWLRKGMSPLQVANIVGHSSLKMIHEIYGHLNVGDAYEALARVLDE